MQKLHLVGFTTDQKGLILSARRGARSGGFQLPLDDALADAVQELRAQQLEASGGADASDDTDAGRPPRVESALPVREIQARLRQGRSVQEVARAAGVDPSWVERFAPPVFAEQAQVISRVRGMALRRARLGPSSHSIGDAVRRNLSERGVALSPEQFASAWTTRQMADGRWVVRFSFRHRKADHTLRFDLDEAKGTVTGADRLSGLLGYVAPPPSPDASDKPKAEVVSRDDRPSAKRATVATGFRADAASARAMSRPAKERARASAAMRKAVSKNVMTAERAVARRGREKAAAAVRAERAAKAAEARARRQQEAAARTKAAAAKKRAAEAARKKAAAAKKRAAQAARKKAAQQAAAQARRAEAALAAAEKAKAAERAAERRAAAVTKPVKKKAGAKKQPVASSKAAAKAPVKKKGTTTRAPARKVATTAPAKKKPVARTTEKKSAAAPKRASPKKTAAKKPLRATALEARATAARARTPATPRPVERSTAPVTSPPAARPEPRPAFGNERPADGSEGVRVIPAPTGPQVIEGRRAAASSSPAIDESQFEAWYAEWLQAQPGRAPSSADRPPRIRPLRAT